MNEVVNTDTRSDRQKINDLREEVEQLRVQLAGCGVAAMQNTEATIKDRLADGDYGYSASYSDVCKAVDREMLYRGALEKLAKLGNGDQYGNSDGNVIAYTALSRALINN